MNPAQEWLTKAQEDFDTAEYNLKGGKVSYAAFLFQQAVEKALKAVLIKEGKPVPKIHDCGVLAQAVHAPPGLLKTAESLTRYYFRTRYPDKALEQIDKEQVERLRGAAREIIGWTTKKC